MEPSQARGFSLLLHHHHCHQSHHHHCHQSHHHHCHHVILCSHHHMMFCPYHHHHHFLFNPSFSQNREAIGAFPLENKFKSDPAAVLDQAYPSGTLILHGDDGLEEAAGEEEDPIFVLTDEWKEFFAKSEAKRKLAKKEAKKNRKQRKDFGASDVLQA